MNANRRPALRDARGIDRTGSAIAEPVHVYAYSLRSDSDRCTAGAADEVPISQELRGQRVHTSGQTGHGERRRAESGTMLRVVRDAIDKQRQQLAAERVTIDPQGDGDRGFLAA